MNLDVNFLITFFRKHTPSKSQGEIGEQEAAASASPSGGGKAPPKWSDSYTTTRGKANRLGVSGEKWDTGVKRGSANQIW